MDRADVIILGGGLVGLTLALALDHHGLSSIVVDPVDPASTMTAAYDGRASAIASASWKMLEAIGVGARLRARGCPIRTIRAADGLSPEALVFDAPADEGPLGIMFENGVLRAALHDAARDAPNLRLIAPARPVATERTDAQVTVTLDDGTVLAGALLVAAEGRNSPTRAAAGIDMARWSYRHNAIVATLGHTLPHHHVAHEIFYPAGPFALLPMLDDAAGHRSAIVWTVDAGDAAAMLALPDRAFRAEAGKRMGGLLGTLTACSPRSTYPLGFHHAVRITDRRLALVGDAAHGIHPIAGQGLNLGLRDAAALTEVLVDGVRLGLDPGDAQLLARYQAWRALDTFMVAAATDGLTRLYGIRGRAARAVRRLGMGVVERTPPLKRALMAEARGETGTLPKLLQGQEA